jgi:hypothetical protein
VGPRLGPVRWGGELDDRAFPASRSSAPGRAHEAEDAEGNGEGEGRLHGEG